MTLLKYHDSTSGTWKPILSSISGGTTILPSDTAPDDTTLFWLDTSADPAAEPIWAEEFTTLDMASAGNPNGRWRPNDVWQPIDQGYADFGAGAHSTWNLNPNESLNGSARSAFSVADSILTIKAIRTPSAWATDIAAKNEQSPGETPPWSGGLMITNTAVEANRFTYGYFEISARFLTAAKGMFPALWLFAANGYNTGKENAEIDIFEIFGHDDGQPWDITVHQKKGDGTAAVGATTGDGQVAVGTITSDTAGWHTYGLDWTASYLRFYKDDVLVEELTGANATFFNGVTMSIRLNYAMDATWFPSGQKSDGTTPDELIMNVDYIRVWESKP